MAKYRITAPDGKTFDIEGEGTQEEALAHFQANYKPPAPDFSNFADLSPFNPTSLWRAFSEGAKAVNHLAYKAGEKTADIATSIGASPEVAAGAGTAVNLGVGSAIPFGPSGKVGTAIAPIVKGVGRSLMQSAIKPTISDIVSGKAARGVNTMLEGNIRATPAGLAQMRSETDMLLNKVQDAVNKSTGSMEKQEVINGIQTVFDRFKNRLTEAERTGDIRGALDEFLSHPWVKNSNVIPVKEAQDLKRGIYQGLGERAYGPQAIPAVSKEAQKNIAHTLKTGIEREIPEVAPMNARISELINAQNVATRRILSDPNKNPLGLGWLYHNPAILLGWEAERSPAIKSMLANWLYRNSAMPGRGAAALTGTIPGILAEMPPPFGALQQ